MWVRQMAWCCFDNHLISQLEIITNYHRLPVLGATQGLLIRHYVTHRTPRSSALGLDLWPVCRQCRQRYLSRADWTNLANFHSHFSLCPLVLTTHIHHWGPVKCRWVFRPRIIKTFSWADSFSFYAGSSFQGPTPLEWHTLSATVQHTMTAQQPRLCLV